MILNGKLSLMQALGIWYEGELDNVYIDILYLLCANKEEEYKALHNKGKISAIHIKKLKKEEYISGHRLEDGHPIPSKKALDIFLPFLSTKTTLQKPIVKKVVDMMEVAKIIRSAYPRHRGNGVLIQNNVNDIHKRLQEFIKQYPQYINTSIDKYKDAVTKYINTGRKNEYEYTKTSCNFVYDRKQGESLLAGLLDMVNESKEKGNITPLTSDGIELA